MEPPEMPKYSVISVITWMYKYAKIHKFIELYTHKPY